MPRYAKKPRTGKATTSGLYRESEDANRYKEAIADRVEKTTDSTARLIEERVGNARLQRMKSEMELAVKRGELIEKKLVEAQAAFLLLSMRAKILALPHSWARRFVGLPDIREASRLLREMVIGALNELTGLPMKVTDPHWLDTLEGDGSPSATVEARKASGPKRRSG